MLTAIFIEFCACAKEIAPSLVMTLSAVTIISVLLCNLKKNKVKKHPNNVTVEGTVRVSVHGPFSNKSDPVFHSSSNSKSTNLGVGPSIRRSLDQKKPANDSLLKEKDDGTPLLSEATTEEETELKKMESSTHRSDSTQKSKESQRIIIKSPAIKHSVEGLEEDRLSDLAIDSSQKSSIEVDSTMDDCNYSAETKPKIVKEISKANLFKCKKGSWKTIEHAPEVVSSKKEQETTNTSSNPSDKSSTRDERMQLHTNDTTESDQD
ncbi:unnamed protein product [Thelazia callipaeda]|uniref:Suppressor protein SRP40-like n=1 Tax=Thelazia callipaeda TaxID=103827 RepID=A0A0N5CZ68_THECL|nr:unnamed protein product [Thelazia callipaeda]